VKVTERDLRRIPSGNLRVGLAEFGAVWSAAEEQAAAKARHGVTDWAAGGVRMTSRWLAGAVTESRGGRRRLPVAPITRTTSPAIEERIEAEYLAAVALAAKADSALVSDRPGFIEAVVATLRWAWRRSGPAPRLGVEVAVRA
jgi:hypothetical protein